jgi:hypothetical protein
MFEPKDGNDDGSGEQQAAGGVSGDADTKMQESDHSDDVVVAPVATPVVVATAAAAVASTPYVDRSNPPYVSVPIVRALADG